METGLNILLGLAYWSCFVGIVSLDTGDAGVALCEKISLLPYSERS